MFGNNHPKISNFLLHQHIILHHVLYSSRRRSESSIKVIEVWQLIQTQSHPIPLPPRVKLAHLLDLDQASTGMTTGSWLVSFGLDLEDALDAVEEELREAYVIPAMVKAMDTAVDGYWMFGGA